MARLRRHRHDFDLIVIGSGAGGAVGASMIAARGKRVAVFEREAIGGECPNFACVPTKALLYAAEIYRQAQQAGQYGITVGHPDFDYPRVRQWKELVVSRTGAAQGTEMFRHEGITLIKGEARFVSPHAVKCNGQVYTAKRFLIGTGSAVAVPPIPGLEPGSYITYREAVDFSRPPKSILVLGGGPIGCEFVQLFSAFGSKVYVAESMERLLGREDHEVGELIGGLFEQRGVGVLTGAMVTRVENKKAGRTVHYHQAGHDHAVTVEEILVATGKRPSLDLDLEKAGIRYGKAGIEINRYLQTSQPHIYAAGDVIGPFLFTHTAEYQSAIAAQNAFGTRKRSPDYLAIPRTVFTAPEVASVGLSEEAAHEKGIRVKIGLSPIAVLGRANTSNEPDGFVKIVTDAKGVIIGSSIVAPRAGEMIHELALAVKLRATAAQVADLVHAFPTFSEAVKFACASVE